MAKAIPCKVIVNNWIGYCFTPHETKSLNEAKRYGRDFIGGFAYRVFNLETGKLIYQGFCDPAWQ